MADVLKQASWVLLLRGILAIVFALLVLFYPGISLATGILSFVVIFGVYMMVDGISTIIGSVTRREGQWFLMLIWGVISVIAALAALANPLLFGTFSLIIMIYIVAFRSIFSGIFEIIAAFRLRQEIDNEWLLALNGIFSLLFGAILLSRPITGIEVLILLTAFYSLMAGVMQIALAFKSRSWSNTAQGQPQAAA